MRERPDDDKVTAGQVVLLLLFACVAALCFAIERLTRIILKLLRLLDERVVRIAIYPKGAIMAGVTFPPIEPGTTEGFTVVGFNKAGRQVPLTAPAVVSTDDPAIATASVNGDGSGGVITAVAAGTTVLHAISGSVVADPAAVPVAADMVVASIAIVPAAAAPAPVQPT